MPSTPPRWPRQPSGAPRSPGPRAGRSWPSPPSGAGAGSPSTSAGRAAALTHLEEAWSRAQALGDPLVGWPPTNAASLICTVYLLDPTHGRSWCRRGLGQPRVDRLAHQHDALADQLVLALATTGELEAARRAAARLPEEAVGRRLVRFLLGEWEEAAAQWQAALDHDLAAGDRHDAVANARWLADALLALGEERRAAEVLHQGLEIAASAPQVPSEVWLRARLAGLATTEPDQAAAHLARCEEVLAAGDDWRGLVGEVALARAAVALRDADWRAAGVAAAAGGHRLRGLPAAVATGGGAAGVGTSTRGRRPAGRGPCPARRGRRRARPDRGPGAVVDRRAHGSREAAPGLNTTSTREHHTRAMTRSHCPRRPGEQRRPRPRSTP